MRILTLAIVLVLTCYSNVSAQYCLTIEQVKAVNWLLDERDWLTEQVKLDSVQLAEYQKALRQSIALEKQARNEAANLDTLYSIESQRSDELQSALNKEQKKVKRRQTLLWIVSAVAIVETAIIGISYGLSTR